MTFKASWTQRCKDKRFLPVLYGFDLIKGIFKGQFASYDMLMTIAPGMIFDTAFSAFINGTTCWLAI